METIKLDLIPGKKMPSLHASQYDDGREHGIDLFENGIAYKLDGTETLTINERKGDDCICSLDIENTFTGSNHIVFASTEQMCAVWGNNICELVIAKGEKTIGTLNFILEVEPSPTENGIESGSEIKNLKTQIEAITDEVIGDNYYTKTQTDNAIATAVEGKADKTDTYTKTQTDNLLNAKANANSVYTKAEVNTKLNAKANVNDVYTKAQVESRLSAKANTGDVYTKSQTDNLLNDKANVTDLPDMTQYYDKSEVDDLLDDKADKSDTYTKEQVDDIVYNILPDDTASGSVANFETDLALPIKSLEVDVNAVQEAGTPTPSSPKAISGWNAITLDVNGNTEVINLGGTYYGGHFTQDKAGHRQFVVTHGYGQITKATNKSGTWDTSTGKGAFWYNTYAGGITWLRLWDNSATNNGIVCDTLQLDSNVTAYDTECGISIFSNEIIRWIDVEKMALSLADYNTYLAEHPINVCYPLKTPIVIDLPDGEPITTHIGTNNIYADTGDTSVVFKDSVNGYVEKKIASVQALALNT